MYIVTLISEYQKEKRSASSELVFSDDKVEETILATSFDITCRAWQVSVFPLSHLDSL